MKIAAKALWYGAATVCAALAPQAFGQGFAALVTPPRFELAAKPGEKLRQVVEITNAAAQAAKYNLKTADWALSESAAVTFDDALRPGSCRPWVAIEARQITVPAGGKYRYRFEVSPPADASAGECRFAILIEGDEQTVQTPGGPTFPVSGRLGVIVYVTLGGAQPNLEVVGTRVSAGEEALPVLMVKNSGIAHGRLAGFLSGTDAAGRRIEFTPSTLPILPGEMRGISLTPYRDADEALKITYPITIRGKLEWGDKTVPFEQSFAR
jgi:fimbrial chaperone protein